MFEVKAKILKNKNINLSNNVFGGNVLGNKMDNGILKVIFTDIPEEGNLINKYVAFCKPDGDIFLLPLNKEDNSFIVTTTISSIPGTWQFLYLSTGAEIIDGEINTDYKVFLSNSSTFIIKDNYLDDTIENEIPDENLKTVYEELNKTVIYLNSDEFKNDLIENLHISEEDIQLIINSLKNDEAFKETLKGEPGEPGYTPKRTIDYWTTEDILAIENYCKEYIDTEILGGVS